MRSTGGRRTSLLFLARRRGKPAEDESATAGASSYASRQPTPTTIPTHPKSLNPHLYASFQQAPLAVTHWSTDLSVPVIHRSFLSSTVITWSVRVLKKLVSAEDLDMAAGCSVGTWAERLPEWLGRQGREDCEAASGDRVRRLRRG